jgi:hypothetical protein
MGDKIRLQEESDFCRYCGDRVKVIHIPDSLNSDVYHCEHCDNFEYKNKSGEILMLGQKNRPIFLEYVKNQIENENLTWKDVGKSLTQL